MPNSRRIARGLGLVPWSRRRRPSARIACQLEALEGRALLSSASGGTIPPPPLHVESHRPTPRAIVSTHQPLIQGVIDGHVAKHPRFYSEYTGPRLPSLNGTRASGALLLGVGYRFTGTVVGPIDPSLPASYAFGVNRGGATAPMTINPPSPSGSGTMGGISLVMFTRRPDIFVDALVVVSTGPAGPSGTVQLMQKDGSPRPKRAIPSQDIGISGNQVSVLVPAPLLPPNGAPPDQYYYAFWAASGDPTSTSDVASFVPEYNITPIGVRRG